MKPLRAWAVVFSDGEIAIAAAPTALGYAIFPTPSGAQEDAEWYQDERPTVIPVLITEIPPTKRKTKKVKK